MNKNSKKNVPATQTSKLDLSVNPRPVEETPALETEKKARVVVVTSV